MLKPSRSRALDTGKPLPIHRKEELQDVDIQAARGIQYVFTGMEKEEEEEKHLQEILTAQVLGLQRQQEDLVIPTPEYQEVEDHATLYKGVLRKSGQYIHAQPFFYEDYPAYDMDEEDTRFLCDEIRERWKLDLSDTVFEEMISQLELNSGTSTISLDEAKLIMKEDDDLILLVYEYWLKKKLRLQHSLIPIVRAEKVGCPVDKKNPYVAFRRRFEKMQTRKNRKLDENSYAVMLKLRRDLHRVVTLLGFVKKRERLKKARLELEVDLLEKRVEIGDWDSRMFNEIKAIRKYRKLEEEAQQEVLPSEDDISVADSDYESDEGPFAFRRKEGVEYRAPLEFRRLLVESDEEGELGVGSLSLGVETDKFIWTKVPGVCFSYARRRVGRGGRVLLDRLPPVHCARVNCVHVHCDTGSGDSCSDSEVGCGVVQPRVHPSLEFVNWDPYKARQEEAEEKQEVIGADTAENRVHTGSDRPAPGSPWKKRYRSEGMKTINMNRVGAHNAATALINPQFIDLFSLSKSSVFTNPG